MRALLNALAVVGRNTRRVFRQLRQAASVSAEGRPAESPARVPPCALLLLGALVAAPAHAELADLTDSEMADVNAQQGVLLNANLRNNVDANLAPIGCTAVLNAPNPCRLGLEFAARAGTWLMLKEYFGTFQLKDLRMDAEALPATNTVYRDAARFDAGGSATCTSPLLPSCNPAGRLALKLSYPGADSPATYDDFLSFLNIGRVWLEFDNGTTPGFQRDTSLNSMFGVRMSDSRALNEPAHMRFLGKSYVYGF